MPISTSTSYPEFVAALPRPRCRGEGCVEAAQTGHVALGTLADTRRGLRSSRTGARRALPMLALALVGAPGCGAGGASGKPDFEQTPAPAVPEAPPTVAGPSTPTLPGPASLPNLPSEPAQREEVECVTVRAEAELAREPVDIIIALDNSGSMDDEARAVESNINGSFAAILEQSGVDYRVILVSEHRERDAQDTAVCITAPLSTLSTCPAGQPGPSERFFQYSTSIGSGNSFDVLLETFDGRREDDFGLAPLGWSEWLRPGAKKVFLEFSDDNANTSASEFLAGLTALSPEDFGPAPNDIRFAWHSIVGVAERAVPADPYAPVDPIEDEECAGNVFNAGTTYQELSRLTGGLRFPICEFDGYDAVFRRIAEDVAETRGVACEFAIPEPPGGRPLDLDKVAASYTPGDGEPPRDLGRVEEPERCGADAFLVGPTGVRLCPQACEVLKADPRGVVDVLFTCQEALLR